jgi:hypothetical protein
MLYFGIVLVLTLATGKVIRALALRPHSAVEASPIRGEQTPAGDNSSHNYDFSAVNDGTGTGAE